MTETQQQQRQSTSTTSKSSGRGSKADEPLLCEFGIWIDQQEKSPWMFQGIRGLSHQKYRPIVIPIDFIHLPTGDYTIAGRDSEVSIERKSVADFYGTILGERDRFERELQRMSELGGPSPMARVICEGHWMAGPPRRPVETDGEYNERAAKQLRSVLGSVRAWQQEFPSVHWVACESRRQAEIECFRTLEMWWRKREREPGELGESK